MENNIQLENLNQIIKNIRDTRRLKNVRYAREHEKLMIICKKERAKILGK